MKKYKSIISTLFVLAIYKVQTATVTNQTKTDVKETRKLQDTYLPVNYQTDIGQNITNVDHNGLGTDTMISAPLETVANPGNPGIYTEQIEEQIIETNSVVDLPQANFSNEINVNDYGLNPNYNANLVLNADTNYKNTVNPLTVQNNQVIHNMGNDISNTQVYYAGNQISDYQKLNNGNVVIINPSISNTGAQVIEINGQNGIISYPSNQQILVNQNQINTQQLGTNIQNGIIQEKKKVETTVNLPPIPEVSDVITVKEFDVFDEIIDELSSLFDSYYKMLPSEEETKDSTKQAINVLKFIKSLSGFIKTVLEKKDHILSNLHFLEDKFSQLSTTQADMLRFFKQDLEYSRIVRLTRQWMDKDQKFGKHFKNIAEYTEKFNNEVKKLVASCYDLSRLAKFFLGEIMKLKEIEINENKLAGMKAIGQGLDVLDQVIMLLVKILNMRASIKTSINNIKMSMFNIKSFKADIQHSLKACENLAIYYELEDKANKAMILKNAGASSINGSRIICIAIGAVLLLTYK